MRNCGVTGTAKFPSRRKQALASLKNSTPKRDQQIGGDALAAVTWAEEHLFDRRSVVLEHELWRHALEHARGQNITIEELQQATRDRGYIRNERKPRQCHNQGTLEREWEIVCLAKNGIGRFRPLAPAIRFAIRDWTQANVRRLVKS